MGNIEREAGLRGQRCGDQIRCIQDPDQETWRRELVVGLGNEHVWGRRERVPEEMVRISR